MDSPLVVLVSLLLAILLPCLYCLVAPSPPRRDFEKEWELELQELDFEYLSPYERFKAGRWNK